MPNDPVLVVTPSYVLIIVVSKEFKNNLSLEKLKIPYLFQYLEILDITKINSYTFLIVHTSNL